MNSFFHSLTSAAYAASAAGRVDLRHCKDKHLNEHSGLPHLFFSDSIDLSAVNFRHHDLVSAALISQYHQILHPDNHGTTVEQLNGIPAIICPPDRNLGEPPGFQHPRGRDFEAFQQANRKEDENFETVSTSTPRLIKPLAT